MTEYQGNVSEQEDIDNATALSHAVALLSVVTGEPWDRAKLLATNGALQQHAVDTLTRQGVLRRDAENLVEERWADYGALENPESEVARDPAQKGFRNVSLQTPSSESNEPPEDWLAPGTIPSFDDIRSKAAARIEHWKSQQKQPEPSEESDGSSEQPDASASSGDTP